MSRDHELTATAIRDTFTAAIDMAEAARCHHLSHWNEIRVASPDPLADGFVSSLLLGSLIESSAHRLGIPAADVWDHIRRTGELPV